MITLNKKNKIVILVALLAIAFAALFVFTNKKPALSAPVKVADKNTVKHKKTAKAASSKKSKIADHNQVSDSNQTIVKNNTNEKIVPAIADVNQPQNAVPANAKTVSVEKAVVDIMQNKETADAKKESFSQIAQIGLTQAKVNNDLVENNEPLIDKTENISLKSANLSAALPANIAPLADAVINSNIQSLIFMRNMPITDALQLLAVRYKKNIVPTGKVTGNLSFTKLNNVSFSEAMNAILGENLKYQEQGNIIKVYASDETGKAKQDSSGMTCKVFTLYYVSAAEAKKLIIPVMSSQGRIEVTTAAKTGVPDSDTIGAGGGGDALAINDMVVLYDYPKQIQQAEQIIDAIDVRPKQVLVEATIMTAKLTEGMQLGIDWKSLGGAVVTGISGLSNGGHDSFSFGGNSANVSQPLTGGISIGIIYKDIAAFIKAVEQITDVTILANPKILATNKQLGQVYIGTKLGYLSSTEQTQTSTTQEVSFLDTGTKLSFRPFIGNDGYIRMDIHPKDSSAAIRQIGGATSTVAVPDETSAELVTNIIVKDGQTIVIGGLFRNKVQTAKTQVPFIGNIPVVGYAFKGTADETIREEVIVLLTPHIIGVPDEARGDDRSDEIANKIISVKKQLNPLNAMRMAQSHYEKAAVYYVQKRNSDAVKELDRAIGLYPDYTEALTLKEKILSEIAPSQRPTREKLDKAENTKNKKWRKR